MKRIVTVCALGILSVMGCRKIKNYPEVPHIEVLSLEEIPGTPQVKAILSFTDGDGDLGLDDADTLPPFDTLSKFYNNLFVEYFDQKNGVWIKDTVFTGGFRTTKITPAGKIKAIDGEFEVMLFFKQEAVPTPDTIKYSFQLYDRALNASNKAESKAIVVNR
ncbi:MAG: hypothetical protein V4616_01520 [Bacteroidota bacterium]